jgi:hypothetical protein
MDFTYLCIYITLGLPLLISYSFIGYLNKNEYENLWTNNGTNILVNKNVRSFNIFTIFLASLAGLYLLYYFTTKNIEDIKISTMSIDVKYIIFIGLLILLGFSLLWLPSFYLMSSKITSSVLFMVSVGSMLLVGSVCYILSKNKLVSNYDILSAIAVFMLLFQTFVMDFLIWSGPGPRSFF